MTQAAPKSAPAAGAADDDYKLAPDAALQSPDLVPLEPDLVPLESDLVPLAPEPAADQAASTRPLTGLPRKPDRVPETARKASGAKPVLIIAAVAGVLVMIVGSLVGGYFALRGDRPLADAVQSPSGGDDSQPKSKRRGDKSDSVLVFDQPLPGITVEAKAETPPLLVDAPPFDTENARRRVKVVSFKSASANETANNEPAKWTAPADPAPSSEPVSYPADLRIPLEKCGAYETERYYPPVMADLGGEFAVLAPAWKSPVFENADLTGPRTKGKSAQKAEPDRKPWLSPGNTTNVSLVAKPADAVPVIDLRSGQKVGEFNFRVPVWRRPVLSPDATYLVGPDSVPDSISGICWIDVFTLYVWKQKEPKPHAKLKVPGWVGWLGFVGNDRLAVLTYDGKPLVQVWDVAKGKVVKSIYLTADQLLQWVVASELPADDRRTSAWYSPLPGMAGVSPGGRYVAIGGKSTATLVDLEEGREVGNVPVSLRDNWSGNYRGISFSRDGTEFSVLTAGEMQMNNGLVKCNVVATWSVTDGRKVRELMSPGESPGPLVAGPDPDILLAAGSILGDFRAYATAIDLTTGRGVYHMPSIVRWSPSGPVLAVGPLPKEGDPAPDGATAVLGGGGDEKGSMGLYAVPDAQARMVTAVGLTEYGLPKRPKLAVVDRSNVQNLTPQPPAEWSAMPAVKPIAPPAENNVLGPTNFWPEGIGDQRAAALRRTHRQKKLNAYSEARYYETTWQQFDLATGQQVAEPIVVAPWVVTPNTYPQRQHLAALSADGQMLAMDDLANPGRIDVWSASGKHVVAFMPYGEPLERADDRGYTAIIQWLGWATNDRLLTLADGKLTAWEIPAAKAVWEIPGEYSRLCHFAPGRTWLAASTVSGLDLIDPLNGALLNRCGVGVNGTITDMCVSPDGAQLAALYVEESVSANAWLQGRLIDDSTEGVAAIWDLATGKARITQKQHIRRFAVLHWGSPEHLAICGHVSSIMDLKLGLTTVHYNLPASGAWPESGFPVNRTPDGRLWASILFSSPTPSERYYVWRPHLVPDPQSKIDGPFLSPDRDYFDPSRTTIRFECSVGDKDLAERAGKILIEGLQRAGFKIGKGGWVLRVTHEVTDTGSIFMNGVNIPKIVYRWQLVDDKGTVLWKEISEGSFPGQSSKYHRQPKLGDQRIPVAPGEFVEHYEFGAKNPRDAIVEEIRERNSGLYLLPTFPKTFFKVGDTFLNQPVTAAFDVTRPEDIEPIKSEPERRP